MTLDRNWTWLDIMIENEFSPHPTPLIIPVSMMSLIASIGAICSGIGFVTVNLKKGDIR